MNRANLIKTIAFVGDYLPRKCGIATFTTDLCTSIAQQFPATDCLVASVSDAGHSYDYPREVRFDIHQDELASYHRAAEFLNVRNADITCLQHEYGIYGGIAGSHILGLLADLHMPVVTTFHTVLRDPNIDQRRVLAEIARISTRVVVMTERSRTFLCDRYDVPESKIDLIAHGIPDIPFVDPSYYKDKLDVGGKLVASTFGLISPNKGIEYMLQAMPAILREFPSFVYIMLGATHPNLLRTEGERYRNSLISLARELKISDNVIFDNRFVELEELTEFIIATDIYVTPYLNPAQSVSGTLAYSFGCGKAVVSTPYWHAEELLADGRGVLVPFSDSVALASAICDLLCDDQRRHAMRKNAYVLGREMVWSQVAQRYMETFENARHGRSESAPIQERAEATTALPPWKLDHWERLTDSTGIFQFANHGIPNFADGYCTDDVARALLLSVKLEELGLDSHMIERFSSTYAAFLQHAYSPDLRRFRNFLSFDHQWHEEFGSDDCQGRAVWALGVCVGRSKRRGLLHLTTSLFQEAGPELIERTSPRTWAFGLLGVVEYCRRFNGDRRIHQLGEMLAAKLLDVFDRCATDDWPWFEEGLTYENARLSQALIAWGEPRGLAIGLRSLEWLVGVQSSPRGDFRAIGSDGFYRKGGELAKFDQQPVEAQATVSACLEAYRVTSNERWLVEARKAFDWFLGHNDLGLPLYDPATGGCFDGLLRDRVNRNQGAESTLAFLLSLADMNLQKCIRSH